MSVSIEKNGSVTTVILSRPEARNAVNPETARALYEAFVAFEQDAEARVAVLHGEGGAFCAGYDLKTVGGSTPWFQQLHFGRDGEPALGPMGPSRLDLSKPVIAAIAGPAVAGGMELALWCDLRVMEENAYMGVYCRRWGVPLIDGGTVRLPRIVGQGRALDLILTGRQVKADECLRIGLCERVVAEGASRVAAEALAAEIARFPQECMKRDRWSAKHQWDLSEAEALQQE
ncbi:MAG: crotonase/enoyl-CoA hydratase family protein, partial [Nevskiales bacterium]